MKFALFLSSLLSLAVAQQSYNYQEEAPAQTFEEEQQPAQQNFVDIYKDGETGLYYEFDKETREFVQVDPAELDFYPLDEEAAATYQADVAQEQEQEYQAAYQAAYQQAYDEAYQQSYNEAYDQSFTETQEAEAQFEAEYEGNDEDADEEYDAADDADDQEYDDADAEADDEE